ncbi:MAG: RHS repeat-associated core domain-containing protein [Anaerolineae bacterium]
MPTFTPTKSSTRYVNDPAAGLTQVLSDGTDTYLYGAGRIAQQGANVQYFGVDGLGSVRQLYNSSGNVIEDMRYDPYGNTLAKSGTGSSMYGFAGEQTDGTSGFVYLRARYYDSSTGRFITKDTWAGDYNNPLTLNQWNYTNGNPVNSVDRTGLNPCDDDPNSTACDEYALQNGGYSNRFGWCLPGGLGCSGGSEYWDQHLGPGNWTLRWLDIVKQEAHNYGVPWQVVAGIYESEQRIDTNVLKDTIPDTFFRLNPWSTRIIDAWPSDMGPGTGNVHYATAQSVASYFANYCDSSMKLDISLGESRSSVGEKLVNEPFTIRFISAYVRELADYRFGTGGSALQASHSSLWEWTITDAVAIWHAYRYGAPKASPEGQGLGFDTIYDFQDKSLSLDAFITSKVTKVKGSEVQVREAKDSARRSISIFQRYFAMAD